MKVKVQNRSVYHKFAEVEIEIPNDVKDIQEWLIKNEHTYIYEMDASINETKYEFGSGVDDYDGMNEPLSESEWRYDCNQLNIGGHL
jgi:hypothetical protein